MIAMLPSLHIECHTLRTLNDANPKNTTNPSRPSTLETGNDNPVNNVPVSDDPADNAPANNFGNTATGTLREHVENRRKAMIGSDSTNSSDDEQQMHSPLNSPRYKSRFSAVRKTLNDELGIILNNKLKQHKQGDPREVVDQNQVPDNSLTPADNSIKLGDRDAGESATVPAKDATNIDVNNALELGRFSMYPLYKLYFADDYEKNTNLNGDTLKSLDLVEMQVKYNIEQLENMRELIIKLDESLQKLNAKIPDDGTIRQFNAFCNKIKKFGKPWINSYELTKGKLVQLNGRIKLIKESIAEGRVGIKNMIFQLFKSVGINLVDGGILADGNAILNDENIDKFTDYLNKLIRGKLEIDSLKMNCYAIQNTQVELYQLLSTHFLDSPVDPENPLVPAGLIPESNTDSGKNKSNNLKKKSMIRERREMQINGNLKNSGSDSDSDDSIGYQPELKRLTQLQSYEDNNDALDQSEDSDSSDYVRINGGFLLPLAITVVLWVL